MRFRRVKSLIALALIRSSALIMVGAGVLIFIYLIVKGSVVINWTFLTDPPRQGMTSGGIFPAIFGTLCLMLLTLTFALPVGVASAIYFAEYAGRGSSHLNILMRLATSILAGVPSIVYGLLGLSLFVLYMRFGFSLLSASLTLSILSLPVIIAASEESLRSVPDSYREAAVALGATKWQVVRHAVLPYAVPGIITSCILALSRAAGETAPILLTGAAYYHPRLPTSILDQFMALPFHIFALATQSVDPVKTRPIQFGAVLILIMLVLGMNMAAILIRIRQRRMAQA
ncbi:MAG: phosphate ABC transporter permease PstA [Candidatus Bathyarchaeia archaeon]